MRVAVVSMETVHHREAAGIRRLDRIARLLGEAGHDVTIFCARWWDDRSVVREDGPVTYRAVSVDPAAPTFAARLPVALGRAGPDVVHAVASPPSAVLAAKLGGVAARAPVVVEWYGDEDLQKSRTTQQAARRPDLIVTPSELVRTEVRERGASGDRTTVVPESIDFGRVEDVEPADRLDVAFAHPLDETANVESLLLGLAELREKDWSATIIGDGPERETYEQQARDLRIEDRVTFAGACDRERRIAVYRGAHVFVQTAFRECFATELLWALACGCVGVVEYQAESSAHELIERRDRSYRVTSTQEMADAIVDAGDFEYRTVDDDFAAFDHGSVRETYENTYDRAEEERGLLR